MCGHGARRAPPFFVAAPRPRPGSAFRFQFQLLRPPVSGARGSRACGSVTGHLVIVHDSAGTKVGCGPLILNNQNENVAAITTIPGYTGSLTVAGTFTFVQAAAQLSGVYTLTGLPAATSGAFHVHAGTSCAAVGGHFPNPSTTANPTPGHVHYSTLGYGVQTSA